MGRPRKTEVAVVPRNDSVEVLLQQAVANNVPVEMMERLFALRKEVKAEQGKEAYTRAIADFQAACPIIKKTKKVMNKDGNTVRYTFAPIDSIVEQIKVHVKNAGLSYRWETKTEGKSITAKCIVTHILGHSESSDFAVDVDEGGFMTGPQKSASALTFAKRYSLCNALGISTGDEDVDATDVKKQKDALQPKAKIIFLLRTLKEDVTDKDKIAASVQKLTSLTLEEKNYGDIVERLEAIVQENNENPDIR